MAAVKEGDFAAIRGEVRKILKQPGYDDGSIGPVLVRLAWHQSGTYSAIDSNGGSNGAGMRFGTEKMDPANAGLHHAITYLMPIQEANPWITHADLWTLAGVEAIEAMGGPKVPWEAGRTDYETEEAATDHRGEIVNRLPDGSKGADHIRDIFGRMGFSDKEIVALSGAHSLGRCHPDRSGFDGPWVVNPTRFSNQYFKLLMTQKWKPREWEGPFQYEATVAGTKLMMLPTDMALVEDEEMRVWVEKYAADKDLFFKDFAMAFGKLIELGVERDDSGFARLAKKAAKEGKPLDKTSLPGKGCPFAGTTGKGRSAKL
ncbi:heme peroxidase [Dioszegia hungarica]|uniref:Peroxidase n=1 Tax=Dioszegia hungarica TaxID=4972 RepID=A0AA38HA45_9TREE|nr:heme peroxidase [Dioszegia hungarica]KAI9637367.1 heme peroxidase [Dioszegia hungarica]